MRARLFLLAAGLVLAACSHPQPGPFFVAFEPDAASRQSIIVNGFSRADARVVARARSIEDWQALVSVHVGDLENASDIAVAGRYELVDAGRVRFMPMMPFEAGRSYVVRIHETALGRHRRGETSYLLRPQAVRTSEPVRVTGLQPALEGVPENLLRLYIHFSGPMGGGAGKDHVRLLDGEGREVVDPFLPIDGSFWNPERTRYTLFLDPGRVKTGILPNARMGRPLRRGQRYTLVIDRRWPTGDGRPLAEEHRQTFTAGAAIAAPLDPRAWPIAAPKPGSRDPFVVRFPHALDHGLLQRALAIERDGTPVEGEFAVPADAREWRFVPASPWAAGPHDLVVLSILEDPSGNRIGRAFEVEGAARGPSGPDRVRIRWSPSQ